MDRETYKQIIQAFAATFQGLRLYPFQHPAIERQVQSLLTGLLTLCQNRGEVRLGLLEGTLFLEDYLFVQTTPAAVEIGRLLQDFQLDGFLFRSGLTSGQLQILFSLLLAGNARGEAVNQQLAAGGVMDIHAVTREAERRRRRETPP